MNFHWEILIRGMVISLAMTLMFELAFARAWGLRNRHDLMVTILVNMLTNPIVVFVYYFIRIRRYSINYGWVTLIMEVWAVVTEALLYKKYARTLDRPWIFSLSANAFSYAVGELINGIR